MAARHWFRFHLSTLLVLTLTSAVLLWLNVRPVSVFWSNHGFPFMAIEKFVPYEYPDGSVYIRLEKGPMLVCRLPCRSNFYIYPRWLLLDIAANLAVLLLVIFASEWLARRRPALQRTTDHGQLTKDD
ncbi:MAG TPA: hypothetical protein VGP72_13085 [Planctomycetota bacterium]|jgi:hypothetical protein